MNDLACFPGWRFAQPGSRQSPYPSPEAVADAISWGR